MSIKLEFSHLLGPGIYDPQREVHIHILNRKYTFTSLMGSTHLWDIYLQWAHIHRGSPSEGKVPISELGATVSVGSIISVFFKLALKINLCD